MVSKRVKQTRWVHQSGHLSHFFDDVLVVASSGVKQELMDKISPFKLSDVINYDPKLMLGWEAEIYTVEVDDGYKVADKIMDHRIRHLAKAKIGGDEQRHVVIHTDKYCQTFKLVMLPVWLCSYLYQNKLYQFSINGQTGKVGGDKPLSYVKIAFFVLMIAAIIGAIIYFTQKN